MCVRGVQVQVGAAPLQCRCGQHDGGSIQVMLQESCCFLEDELKVYP